MFPPHAMVEFVLVCMNEIGGQSYDTLYPCVCLIDRLAAEMSYAEFAEALNTWEGEQWRLGGGTT